MTTDTTQPEQPTEQADDTAGRWDAAKEAAAPRAEKARSAFREQKKHVSRRLGDWFATADVTDEELLDRVLERKATQHQQKITELERQVGRLHAQLATTKAIAERDDATGSQRAAMARIAGELSSRESALDFARSHTVTVQPSDLNKARLGRQAARAGLAAAGTLGALKGVAVEPGLLLALGAGGGFGWYALSRPFEPGQAAALAVTTPPQNLATPPVSLTKDNPPAPHGGVEQRAFDAPPPPALSAEALTKALRETRVIKPDAEVTVLAAPAWGEDGTATTVFDLPPGVTVAMLQKKLEELAGALGRDSAMVDVTKAGAAGRASLWMTDADPFAAARPSPLLGGKGSVDAWRDGVPVAWAKRGNTISLPVKNSNFLIAGMTRSGKGVGAANLAVGAAMDPRINLRIVAGKTNGEWDPYAKAGVAATYFKPNAARLLALLQALIADMDRRNKVLGDLGKSKLTPESIQRLGGIELLVIDELATYTRPGKPHRDEILEALIQLSAVAAGAGILLVLITQYPEVDVIPQGLAMNCGTRWAMRVDNATQSNAILGGGASGSGRDASKFDPPLPGLGWLVNPFAGVTDLARSFDLDEDERGEVTQLLTRAADLRKAAGRLAGQWEDPIEQHLLNTTGLSSAAGGPKSSGEPGRARAQLTPEQRQQLDAVRGALAAMDELGRDAAQLPEMAKVIGGSMTGERLGELLRAAGAGGTVKVTIPGRPGRVNGYNRADIKSALRFLEGA